MSGRTFPLSLMLLAAALAIIAGGCNKTGQTTTDETTAIVDELSPDDASQADDDTTNDNAADVAESEREDPAADEGDDGTSTDGAVAGLVASVNGEPLTMAEFQRQTWDTQRYFVEQGLDPNTESGQMELLVLRREVLVDMIHQLLIEQAAAEMGIAATDQEVAESLSQYEAELDQSLEDAGVTRSEAEEMERKAIVGRRFVDALSKDLATVAPFYRARHILCEHADRARCEAALTRLEAGEDFAAVVQDISADETTAETGGDLDWIPRVPGVTVLPSPELEEAIFALDKGQRSSIIETEYGHHIVEVVEIDPARELDDEQRFQLRQRRVQEWLNDRVTGSDIVIYPEDLRDAIARR